MMSLRGLLIAAILLASLGGAAYWSEKHKKPENKPSADAAPKILTIPEDQFKQLALNKKGGDSTVLSKSDAGKWQITGPKPLPADQDSVSSLVSSLSSLSSDKLVEDKASDLSSYGLNAPSEEITVKKKDGNTQKLLLGDDTPTGSGVYAKLENDPRIFTVATYVKSNLDKTAKDLRDKRLLTFNSDKLTRVDLQAKGQNVEFGKNNQNDWQILKPKPLRADGSQVEELIRKLKDAKMDTSVTDEDAKKAGAAFASATKVAVAVVTDSGGSQQIEVRKDKDKNYYAKSSVVEGIYKVPADLGDGLDKGLDDFRNKKLFDFGWNDPTKVDLHNGLVSATYQKSGDKWMSGAKQMDSVTIQTLLDKLRDLSSVKFLETDGGSPVFDATVTSNDGKRVEKLTITKLGDKYFAKRENEPAVYELESKAVEELQKAASDVKEAQPPKKK